VLFLAAFAFFASIVHVFLFVGFHPLRRLAGYLLFVVGSFLCPRKGKTRQSATQMVVSNCGHLSSPRNPPPRQWLPARASKVNCRSVCTSNKPLGPSCLTASARDGDHCGCELGVTVHRLTSHHEPRGTTYNTSLNPCSRFPSYVALLFFVLRLHRLIIKSGQAPFLHSALLFFDPQSRAL